MGVIESVQSYDLNIPVGGTQKIDVMGDRVQFLSAVDPFAQIELRPNYTQGNINLKPGQGFRFSEAVNGWVVFNKGTVAITGVLIIGNGDFFDQRISGEVSVIDGGKARTMSGAAFMATQYQAAVAGQYSSVQLWNPAGNTKRLVVEAIAAASTLAIGFQIRTAIAALTTAGLAPVSKNIGGSGATAQTYSQASAAAPGPLMLMQGYLQASTLYEKKMNEPIVIQPGFGVIVMGNALNADMTASFEFFEEAF